MDKQFIKRTKSRCAVCQIECDGIVSKVGNDIIMDRTCPVHGEQPFRINDARFYWESKGQEANSCCGSGGCCSADGKDSGTLGKNALSPTQIIEQLASCTALIDIVDSCNLKCPTCYASSPVGTGENLKYVSFEEVCSRVQGVIDRKGEIELLQLSGGEPTLHPDFFKILTWAFDNPGIRHVLLNTNGLRIATDDVFVEEFKKVFQPGKMRLYLQFDGPQEAGQQALRGADLRQMRIRAIERCAEIGLTLHLAMTVNGDNFAHLWDALLFGTKYPHVLGISFQPMFLSGRGTGKIDEQPLTAGDIILGLIDQSAGAMIAEDFTPLPCGDPNCQIVSGLARSDDGEIIPVVRYLDRAAIDKVLHNKINFDIEALKSCGCDGQPLAEFLKEHVLLAKHGFFIFIKPFMDARTWDQDRIDRCCTHVIRPDGKLDSFCRYYSGFSDTQETGVRAGRRLAVIG